MPQINDYGLYFNGTIRKSLIGFSDMFNRIFTVVDEPDPSNPSVRRKRNYLVPVKLTTQERFLAFYRVIEQRRQIGIVLPVIGFNITGLQLDTDRTKLPTNKIFDSDGKEWVFQPVPVTLNMELNIWTKTLGELLDIIEWIVPKYQTPRSYPLIELKFYDGSQIQRDMIVSLDGTNFEVTDIDIDAQSGDRIVQTSLNFTVTSTLYHVIVNALGPTIGSFSGPNNEDATGLGVRANDVSLTGIKVIDVDFENMIGKKWETLHIVPTENTIVGNP